jgi:hypothetical protein
MRNGLICKITDKMKIQETSFKADNSNQARNQLAKISINATMINRGAARTGGSNNTMDRCSDGDEANCDSQMHGWEINFGISNCMQIA